MKESIDDILAFYEGKIDHFDVEKHIEYDPKHVNLENSGLDKRGRTTRFEAITGLTILWDEDYA